MLKKFIKSGVFLVLFVLNRLALPFMRRSEIIVLMHHSVGPGNWQFTVKPEAFKWQIEYLVKNKFLFITAEELYQILVGRKIAPRRAVLITFDDGYRDIKDWALPVLKEFNIPSIVFIHSNRSSENLGNDLPLLSWEDIHEMMENKVEIDNHSHSHPDLKTLSPDELMSEIRKSEEMFEKEISQKPKFFAFPGGRYDQQVVDRLKDDGYKMAFTINPYLISLKNDRLKLPRVGVIRDTGRIEFMARTSYANDWYQDFVGTLFSGKPKK